jgi:cell division septum initiation protein DivIVA
MRKQIVIILGLASLLAVAAYAGQDELAGSIKQAREEATTTSGQLTAALSALNGLVNQKEGDLSPAYQAFRAELPKTRNAATATTSRVERMGKERQTYFADWQATINSINNSSLQKKAQKRLNRASDSYGKVEAALTQASEKFKPFLSDLNDVDKALSQDVTTDGIKSMKGVVRDANWNYKSVSSAVNRALKEMEKMEKALSSQAT